MTTQSDVQADLIAELGLDNLPADKKEELVIKMTEVVLKRIFVETMEKLSEQDQRAYSDMIDVNAAPEEVDIFVKSKIVNYEEMVRKIAEQFKAEMIGQQI